MITTPHTDSRRDLAGLAGDHGDRTRGGVALRLASAPLPRQRLPALRRSGTTQKHPTAHRCAGLPALPPLRRNPLDPTPHLTVQRTAMIAESAGSCALLHGYLPLSAIIPDAPRPLTRNVRYLPMQYETNKQLRKTGPCSELREHYGQGETQKQRRKQQNRQVPDTGAVVPIRPGEPGAGAQ